MRSTASQLTVDSHESGVITKYLLYLNKPKSPRHQLFGSIDIVAGVETLSEPVISTPTTTTTAAKRPRGPSIDSYFHLHINPFNKLDIRTHQQPPLKGW